MTLSTSPIAPSEVSANPLRVARTKRRVRARALRARSERGVALLMVLTTVALLFVMGQQLREDVEVSYSAASVSRDQLIAHYEAKSGINLARLLLFSEPTIRRAVMATLGPLMAMFGGPPGQIPVWEQVDTLFAAFRRSEGNSALSETFGVNAATAKNLGGLRGAEPILIVDEDSKINVNGASRGAEVARREAARLVGLTSNPAYEPLFAQRDSDGQFTDRSTLLREIVDYSDQDQTSFDIGQLLNNSVSGPSAGGPEDGFYNALRPGYPRKNAPYDSVEELRMVRGLGDDDLWHAIVDPDPANPRRRNLTVWGSGQVNVNTANGQTLLAVICAFGASSAPCTDAMAARRFITGITMVQGFTVSMGLPIFGSPTMFVQTVQGQGMLGQMMRTFAGDRPIEVRDAGGLERAITVESKVFSVYAASRVGMAYTRIHAVIDMRTQPPIDSSYLRITAGGSDVLPTAPTAPNPNLPGGGLVQGPNGTPQVQEARGGTIVYWRED
ncbi:MAG: type II secretion system protein GspK [Deltaproteobacteria bacterium]|nr:type II secretion system protein GspK [Deltaproteobacteria bacterium]